MKRLQRAGMYIPCARRIGLLIVLALGAVAGCVEPEEIEEDNLSDEPAVAPEDADDETSANDMDDTSTATTTDDVTQQCLTPSCRKLGGN